MSFNWFSVSACLIILLLQSGNADCQVVVGTLPNLQHGISGTLELVSTTQIRVTGFSYDGGGPAAFLYYFVPGASVVTGAGIKISYPDGGQSDGSFRLGGRFSNDVITFSLPSGTTVCNIGTFTIWCQAARSFFTKLEFPRTLFDRNGADPCAFAAPPTPPPTMAPAAVVAGTLPSDGHDVGGMLTFLTTTRIRIVGFSYDGTAPATYLYYYAPGVPAMPTGGGVKIPLASDNGGNAQGAFATGNRYSNQDVTVDLPSGMDVCDIGTFTVWCEEANVFFSTLEISRTLFENNGADPCTLKGGTSIATPSPDQYENCEVFSPGLQLRWTVDRAQSKIRFMLRGCQSKNVQVAQYMGFGLSGSTSATLMDGADATITWVGNDGQPNAVDYFLRSRTQCRSGMGVCPDEMDSRGTCQNNVEEISGKNTNREQRVSFTRSFNTTDTDCDVPFNVDSDQYIVWAIGGVEQTAFRHNFRSASTTAAIRFGRSATDNCGTSAITCDSCDAFPATRMDARSSSTFFTATIGPSGNDRGYTAITSQVGWGIAWYINGSLVPELVLERGKTYTFQVEGGSNPTDAANYHPFYITDSSIGGRLLNTAEEKQGEKVYAGFSANDVPTGVGRLCASVETDTSFRILERCGPFSEFEESLTKNCRSGQPGVLKWTPDRDTPDLVYYQCATHRNLGWKIQVVDSGTLPVAVSMFVFAGLAVLVNTLYWR